MEINNGINIKNISLDKKVLLIKFSSRDDLMLIKENIEYPCNFSEHIENCLEIHSEDIAKLQKDLFNMLSKKNIIVNTVTIKQDSLEEIFLKEVRANG